MPNSQLSEPISEPIAEMVDVATAAAMLNTTTKFVRRRIADDTLPAYRIAGSKLIRVRRADVEVLMQPTNQGALPESVADHVAKILAEAPPLNDEQRIRLAELLTPARRGGEGV